MCIVRGHYAKTEVATLSSYPGKFGFLSSEHRDGVDEQQ
jgi:hypothetical protein